MDTKLPSEVDDYYPHIHHDIKGESVQRLCHSLARREWDALVEGAHAQVLRSFALYGPNADPQKIAREVSDYVLKMGYPVSEVVEGLFTSSVRGSGVRVRIVSAQSHAASVHFELLPETKEGQTPIRGSVKFIVPCTGATVPTRSSVWAD